MGRSWRDILRRGKRRVPKPVAQPPGRAPQSLLLASVVEGRGWGKEFDAGENCQVACPWKSFSQLLLGNGESRQKVSPIILPLCRKENRGPQDSVQGEVFWMLYLRWEGYLFRDPSCAPAEGSLPAQWPLPPGNPATRAPQDPPSQSPWHCMPLGQLDPLLPVTGPVFKFLRLC